MMSSLRHSFSVSKHFRSPAFLAPFPCRNPATLFFPQHRVNRLHLKKLYVRPTSATHTTPGTSIKARVTASTSLKQDTQKDKEPTQASLLAHLKLKVSQSATRKIALTIEEAEDGTNEWGRLSIRPDAAAYNLAIRALIRAERPDLAVSLFRRRVEARRSRPELSADPTLTAAVVRSVLRHARKRDERVELSSEVFAALTTEADGILRVAEVEKENKEAVGEDLSRLVLAFANLVSASLIAVHRGEPVKDYDMRRAYTAMDYVRRLSQAFGSRVALDVAEYNEMIRALGKTRKLNDVFDVLDVMRTCGVQRDGTTFEYLANAAVRQVRFVTGATSMDTLPNPIASEVAFVGRSNVGKSSLVNMICSRRALAYVSGRPGKTQQFNYFLINERDPSSQFYLVDLPGVGYARVPRPVQQNWLNFMTQYFQHRVSLRLVFHLIDGRHGALKDDEELMQQMGILRGAFKYILVLTKMDKTGKQKAKQTIIDATRAALVRNGCAEDIPMVLTSAQTKLGRDEMWRHLRAAIAPLSDFESKR